MIERWLPVLGWEGLYEVSDLGRVRSLARMVPMPAQNGPDALRFWPGRILEPGPNTGGYPTVQMSVIGRKAVRRPVHRLVLDAFVGPKPPGMEARHFPDGDKFNNRLANLAWGTCAENAADKAVLGQLLKGEQHPRAKLTNEQVREIRAGVAAGESKTSIGRRFGVHRRSILDIVTGRTWRHVEEIMPDTGTEAFGRGDLTADLYRSASS